MPKVTVYTREMCPYCTRALRLLQSKDVDFEQIDAGFDRELKQQMVQRSGGRATFPQIFIGDHHVGGLAVVGSR